ncbi:MAG: glycosyltransferase [Solirubrobacteraceae bacterium]
MDLDPRERAAACSQANAPGSPLRILVINSEVPSRDRDSGSLRLFRIIEILAGEGHEITLIGREGLPGIERATAELAAIGVEVFPSDPDRMRELGAPLPPGRGIDLPRLLRRGRYDLALVSFFNVAEQYLPLIRAHSPLTRVVIDTVDVHHVRERRGAELNGDPGAVAAAERTRQREQAIYGAADALVAVSEQDAAELRRLAPELPTFVVSNVHQLVGDSPGFDARRGLVFVGGFPHAPNADAVLSFHREAWPLVRAALPDVPLTLVGNRPPPEIAALAGDGITVTGWVPEVAPLLDAARVSIAPLRYGAGVKGKIGEALSHGLPVVTTSIGAEGMSLVDGEHALVADTAEDFAAAVIQLHRDRKLWERLRTRGRSHIAALLGPDAARSSIRRLIDGAARTPFVLSAASPDCERAICSYAKAFTPSDPTSLVLSVEPGDDAAAERAFAQAARTLAAAGLAPDGVADIQIAPIGDATLPSHAVRLSDEGGPRTLNVSADAPRWRELAKPRSAGLRRRTDRAPRAAVVLHATDDASTLKAQLDAIHAARLTEDAELVVAVDAPGPATEALLQTLGSVRIIRAASALGRHQAWQLGAHSTRAPHVIALGPLVVPSSGLIDAMLASLLTGGALAGPLVDGCAGLDAAADGSLWPRRLTAEGEPAALPLDCLAAERELFVDGLPNFPYGEGHVELQLAQWAAARGGLALASSAEVVRLPPPDATVIVCTRNRCEELPDAIGQLLLAGARDVVIVDNASTDATPQVAAELATRSEGRVRVVSEPRGGLCHARNAGAAAAHHNLLLYIDDDARPAPGWLSHLAHAVARPGVVNAGGPIAALWSEQRQPGWPGRSLEPLLGVLDLGDVERRLRPPDVVYGGNWAIRRDALTAVGGFDPSFGIGPEARIGGDEVSVAWRLHERALGEMVYVPGAAVGHRIAPAHVDDRFMIERALRVGVEGPRHAHAIGQGSPDRLLQQARTAAQQLFLIAPLTGDLDVASALAQVSRAPTDLARRVAAAMSLGELAAAVALLGESEAQLGALRLRIDGTALLRGIVTEPVPLAA